MVNNSQSEELIVVLYFDRSIRNYNNNLGTDCNVLLFKVLIKSFSSTKFKLLQDKSFYFATIKVCWFAEPSPSITRPWY